MRTPVALAVLLASSTSFALPPNAAPGLRPGANHHTGDDGFVADLGRAPHAGEEKLRMHEHFIAVRDRLAARSATRPELEGKRHQLLAALDAYIAAGLTPDNDALPWRTPVFIDGKGTICAVGFLIQESAGRPLAEKIAAAHRYSFIEDIAAAMPEVRDWVAASGFTLDELGQIQPGYEGPDVLLWRPLDVAKLEDGPFHDPAARDGDGPALGMIVHHQMEGAWVHHGDDGAVLGVGTFRRGAGVWTSYYAGGVVLASGPFAHSAPSGTWKLFHPSGRLAAEGRFAAGQRVGRWRFYYDDAAATPIAIGAFAAGGSVTGTWKHYDARGALLATSRADEVPDSWRHKNQMFWSTGNRIDIAPTGDGIRHQIHAGSIDGDNHRLDELTTADGRERVFLRYDTRDLFDADGHKLVRLDGRGVAADGSTAAGRRGELDGRGIAADGSTAAGRRGEIDGRGVAADGSTAAGRRGELDGRGVAADGSTAEGRRGEIDGGWRADDCHWNGARRRAARAGDLARLHGYIYDADGEACTVGAPVPADRAARITQLDASMTEVRAASPAFLEELALDGRAPDPAAGPAQAENLTDVLAANMALDIEWPHVDGRFIRVFETLPGYDR